MLGFGFNARIVTTNTITCDASVGGLNGDLYNYNGYWISGCKMFEDTQ